MARIRTVKPDYFTHPSVVGLSIPARLLFVSLWTQADDAGRLYDQPMRIRGLAFGDDDKVNIGTLLEELAMAGRILRYEIGDRRCIQVMDFDQHQKVNRPSESSVPPPGLFSERSMNGQGVLHEVSLGERNGRERNEEGKGITRAAIAAACERFWKVYPRKEEKAGAFRKIEGLLRGGLEPEELITGAERYATAVASLDRKYVKQPTRWLNNGCWTDEYGGDNGVGSEAWIARMMADNPA